MRWGFLGFGAAVGRYPLCDRGENTSMRRVLPDFVVALCRYPQLLASP